MITDAQLHFWALYMVPIQTDVGTKRGWAAPEAEGLSWENKYPYKPLATIASMDSFVVFFKSHRHSMYGLRVMDRTLEEPYPGLHQKPALSSIFNLSCISL